MYSTPNAYLLLVGQPPNVVDVALPDGYLPLGLYERVFLCEYVLELLRFALLLGQHVVLDPQGLLHDLADTVRGVIVDGLGLVGGLTYGQVIQDVFIVSLVYEKLVLVLLDNYVPRVKGFRGCHDCRYS